jgi:hypothetical protein
MKRELGVFRCVSCAERPEDWLRWARSEGKEWPDGEQIATWVEVMPPLEQEVECICCGLPAQLIEPLGIAPPSRRS